MTQPIETPAQPADAKIDVQQYLNGIEGLIACRGGRTGRKIHRAYSGSSVTLCGHWMRYNSDNFRIREMQVPKSCLCEKCF